MACSSTMVDDVRRAFAGMVGERLARYETAQLQLPDGTWDDWPDLPIRLYTLQGNMLAIAWSDFDNLWLRRDDSLPFALDEATIRWIDNGIPKINGCLEQIIRGVQIGRGEMSIRGTDIEVWTRLVIRFEDCWLEIFNALDENAYELHLARPSGEFVDCI